MKKNTIIFDATQAWFEISAVIKGSSTSHCYTDCHVTKDVYMTQGNKSTLLTRTEKEIIWEMFEKYCQWKQTEFAYDVQDVVNYVLREISREGYRGAPIHCLMIDEVQDLTPAMLLLLWKVTTHQIFLSGDTAQTIAKGVGFRFKDINSICRYDESMRDNPPVTKSLTINYRSHQQILDLANNLVSAMEILFPKLIDKLAHESGPDLGPKPVLIRGSDESSLLSSLFTKAESDNKEMTFGSNQVILVRNEAVKQALPDCLQLFSNLTIYESKGLEFSDVLLYNFFTTSQVEEQDWKLVNALFINPETALPFPNTEINKAKAKQLLAKYPLSKHAELCTDMKMLYVAITRTKMRLIIYESDYDKGRFLLDTWNSLRLIRFVRVASEAKGLLWISPESQTASTAESWKEQGNSMMKHEYFRQAIKCYRRAHEPRMENEATAMALADEGSKELNMALAALSRKDLSRGDKEIIQKDRGVALGKLTEAAGVFQSLGMTKRSAQCDFSCKQYTSALGKFTQINAWQECAECHIQLDQYVDAARCYEQANDYRRAIECYKHSSLWKDILLCIERFKDRAPKKQLEAYAYHYLTVFCKNGYELRIGTQESEDTSAQEEEKHVSLPENNELMTRGLLLDLVESVLNSSIHTHKSTHQEPIPVPVSTDVFSTRSINEVGKTILWAISLLSPMLKETLSLSKSGSVLTEMWTGAFEQVFNSDWLFVFNVLDVLGLPDVGIWLAREHKLPNVLKHFQISLAHLAAKSEPLDLELILEESNVRERKKVARTASKKIEKSILETRNFKSSASQLYALEQGLLLMGYIHVLQNYGNSLLQDALLQSIGDYKEEKETLPSASEEKKIKYLYYCISLYQQKHPLCINVRSQEFPATPRFKRVLVCNKALWEYLLTYSYEAKGDLFFALRRNVLSLKTLLLHKATDSRLQLADVCSMLTEFVFALSGTQFQSFQFDFISFMALLKAVKVCVKLLQRRTKLLQDSSVRYHWVVLQEALLVPLHIHRIHAQGLTQCLPIHSHYVVHNSSSLFLDIVTVYENRGEPLIPYDLKGRFFFVQLDIVNDLLCKKFVTVVTSLVVRRHSLMQIHSNEIQKDGLYELNIPVRDWNNWEQRKMFQQDLQACTFANLYGEVTYLFSIQRLFGKTYELASKRRQPSDSKLRELCQKLATLTGSLEEDEDQEYLDYLQRVNKAEINKVNAELKALEQAGAYNDLSLLLLEYKYHMQQLVNWCWNYYPITPIAKKGLLQDSIYEVSSTLTEDVQSLLQYDKIFHICQERPQFLYLLQEKMRRDPGFSEALHGFLPFFPRHLLVTGVYDELTKWCLTAASFFASPEFKEEQISMLTLSALFSLLQCTDFLCLPMDFKWELHSLCWEGRDEYQWRVISDPEKGKTGLKETFERLNEMLIRVTGDRQFRGKLKYRTRKLIHYCLFNADFEYPQLYDTLTSDQLGVHFFESVDKYQFVRSMIEQLEQQHQERNADKVIRVSLPQFESKCAPERAKNTIKLTPADSNLNETPKIETSELHFLSCLQQIRIHDLISFPCCGKYQTVLFDLLKALRYECKNQREAHLIASFIFNCERSWKETENEIKQLGHLENIHQIELLELYFSSVHAKLREWRAIREERPTWLEPENLLPNKLA